MSDLVIIAIVDGPLSGGLPKAISLLATNDIPDLSVYGIESASNGATSNGAEFILSGSAAAGDIITISSEAEGYEQFFGVAPTFTTGVLSINGDDAILLFENGLIVDAYGEVGVDGTGEPWEHLDSYAIRETSLAAPTFDADDWRVLPPNTLDGSIEPPSELQLAFIGPESPEAIQINEYRVAQSGDDVDEFIELFIPEGTDLTSLSLVAFSGEFNPGVVDSVIPLAGGVPDENGLLLIARPDNTALGTGDISVEGLDLFNSPQTLMVVDGFTGAEGADLDVDDNGNLETAINALASISLIDGDETPDVNYSDEIVSDPSGFTPASAKRDPDLTGSFVLQDFSDTSADTPGALNEIDTSGGTVATIMEIQGAGHVSPFVLAEDQTVADFFESLPGDTVSISGAVVETSGIVTAVDSNGFYMQDETGDGDDATSDAIFVFTGSEPSVSIGDVVDVSGTVSEFFPGDTDTRNLPTTQLSGAVVTVTDTGADLPEAVIIGQGGRIPISGNIDDDSFASFDPTEDGIDYFEAMEGMLVTLQDAMAIAPTNRFGEIFAVADQGADATGITSRDTLLLTEGDFNSEKVQIDEDSGLFDFDFPNVDAGALLGDVTGIVGYSFGNFEILPTEDFTPNITDSTLTPEVTTVSDDPARLTVASYNVLNLDPIIETPANTTEPDDDDEVDDDVGNGRFELIADQIVNNLNSPDIIGLQEIQDNTGAEIVDSVTSASDTLQLLIDEIAAAGGPTYEFIDNTFIIDDLSGGQPGGNIRPAFLYNPDRVDFVDGSDRPIGDQADESSPFNGARLPIAADFIFNGETVTVVSAHLSSKGGSAPIMGIEQPFDERQEETVLNGGEEINGSLDERQAQAQEINDFVDSILADDPDANLVVVGDMNEFEFVSPLEILEGSTEFDPATGAVSDSGDDDVLENLVPRVEDDDRYTFIFQGNAQVLDHILVTPNLADDAEIDMVHVNVDFAETEQRASDHDPVIASLVIGGDAQQTDSVLTQVARGETGIFDESAAEIVVHENGRFFVTNADLSRVDIYEQNGDTLEQIGFIDVGEGGPNSVAVNNGFVAVAVQAEEQTDNGFVKLYDATTLDELAVLDAGGSLPDMLTFSRDGSQIFVAIEGEEDNDIDPLGGVTVIDLNTSDLANSTVTFADFTAFNGDRETLIEAGVRIFEGKSVAEDLEPEYIAEGDGKLYVTLQEANSLAVLDLATNTFTDIVPLGLKDHSIEGNGLDASDRDDAINIETYPIFGMFMPDTIASYEVDGRYYFITANEGDDRGEDERIADLNLDPEAFPNAEELQADEALGRLGASSIDGDTDGDGDIDVIQVYGARSFSIWDDEGNLVFDSGDQFEQIVAANLAEQFNANNDDPFEVDNRSDNKGPEPEAVTVAEIEGRQIAIIGLERQNGLMIYDVSTPAAPEFIEFVSTVDPADASESDDNFPNSDLGPESIIVIPADESSSGKPQIAVANEVSGTVSLYDLNLPDAEPEAAFTLELLHMADQEAGSLAVVDAPNAAVLMNALEAQDLGNDGVADNTIRLSSGDAIIPGLFYDASGPAFGAPGIGDIQIQNELGFDAIALGNHEFDFGTRELSELITGQDVEDDSDPEDGFVDTVPKSIGNFGTLTGTVLDGLEFGGTEFAYLSTNLDFSSDSFLAPLEVEGGQAPQGGTVTSSVVLEEGGELIGVVGATTPTLGSISSPGDTGISPTWEGRTPTQEELEALAAEIQTEVDALLAANPDMNKVILLSHMQQIEIEFALAELLSGVDVIVAGGSNTRLFDDQDIPREGDSDQGQYPVFIEDVDGNSVAVVNTDGSYKYVGRLVIDFDEDGNIIPSSYDENVSGAFSTAAQDIFDTLSDGMPTGLEMSEDQQVNPVVDTASTASFDVELVSGDLNTGATLTISGSFSDLTSDLNAVGPVDSEGNPQSAIHLHSGAPGENGGILRNLTVTDNGDGSGSFTGTFDFSASEIDEIFKGQTYLNLHTVDNPSGELRGQVEFTLAGTNEVFSSFVDAEVEAIADVVGDEIIASEGNVLGVSRVFLNGNRSGVEGDPDGVRTQETNLGNLTADANLVYAQSVDETVTVSIKNGGGIRASIGDTVVPAGETEAVRVPNEPVLDADGNVVKPVGGISENDIKTTLAFNNGLTLLTLTREELVAVLEHGVSALPGVAGAFPQVSGVQFSFDADLPAGSRIVNAAITDADGNDLDVLVADGVLQGDPNAEVRIVTLDFLAGPRFDEGGNFTGGGDGYPFPNTDDPDVAARVNPVTLEVEDTQTGTSTFADDGTEQDALAEYLQAEFGSFEDGYRGVDTGPSGDERIQNLDFRADTVLDGEVRTILEVGDGGGALEGSDASEILIGSDNDDMITTGGGNNVVRTGLGNDQVILGDGANEVIGRLDDFFGDTLEEFTEDDVLTFEQTGLLRSDLSIREGSAIVDVDEDGDGSAEGSFTLEGDFFDDDGNLADGDFMATNLGGNTAFTFETFLPELADSQRLNSDLVNGINNQDFLTGTGANEFEITVRDLGFANFNNSIGVYEINALGEISDIQVLFDNANQSDGMSARITDVDAGHTLGFFIIQKGAGFSARLSETDVLAFETESGGAANAFGDEALVLSLNGEAIDEFVFHSFDADLNVDGIEHAISGVELGGEQITVSFEDKLNAGDRDYEDVSFFVDSIEVI